jgi:hypothetical protein
MTPGLELIDLLRFTWIEVQAPKFIKSEFHRSKKF